MPIQLENKKTNNIKIGNKAVNKVYLGDKSIYSSVKIYGIKRQLSSEEPEWIRIEDSVGLVAEATHDGGTVRNDFDNIPPWSNIKSCDLLPDGTISSYIDDDNYDAKNPKGNIMTEIPDLYYNRYQLDGWEYIYVSNNKTEKTPYLSKKFYVARYPLSGNGSKSGVSPIVSRTVTSNRNQAISIGEKWGLLDIWALSIIQLLYLVEYASYYSYSVLGKGDTTRNSTSASKTGAVDDLKMKSGCKYNTGTSSVIYRGIESPYGSPMQIIDGILLIDKTYYVSNDRNNYSSTSTTDYTKLEYGYEGALSYSQIQTVGYDESFPTLQLPQLTGGTTSTYITDGVIFASYSESSPGKITIGTWSGGGEKAGMFYYASNTTSKTDSSLSTRIMYIPE